MGEEGVSTCRTTSRLFPRPLPSCRVTHPDKDDPMDENARAPAPSVAIDALLPAETARKAETIGAQKARLGLLNLIVLSVLAGAFIAFGAMFATTVMAGATGVLPFGMTRLIGGLVFSLGLILVVVGGA